VPPSNLPTAPCYRPQEYLVLGLIWQIVKIQLMSKVDIKHHPEIVRTPAGGHIRGKAVR
jgi:plastin-1